MTEDLVAWLHCCLDEDERIARAAFDPKHPGDWAWRKDSRATVRTADGTTIEPAAPGIERGPHIARWHPARVLREVAAKRAIIDRHDPGHGLYCAECRRDLFHSNLMARWPCWHMRVLAQPYAGEPGFRPEWRSTE